MVKKKKARRRHRQIKLDQSPEAVEAARAAEKAMAQRPLGSPGKEGAVGRLRQRDRQHQGDHQSR